MSEPSTKAMAAAEEIVAAVERYILKITRMGFSDPENRKGVVKAVATVIDRHFVGGADLGAIGVLEGIAEMDGGIAGQTARAYLRGYHRRQGGGERGETDDQDVSGR